MTALIENETINTNKLDVWDYIHQLGAGWHIYDYHYIEKEFIFKNFINAFHFTNKVGELALRNGHYPTIRLSDGKVKVSIWTQEEDGEYLTEHDFNLATKIQGIYDTQKII